MGIRDAVGAFTMQENSRQGRRLPSCGWQHERRLLF